MPLNARFYALVEGLMAPAMGTENVGPLLYSLVRMARPRTTLEVGAGYTTPFIAEALKDNLLEFQADRAILQGSSESSPRKSLLLPEHFARDYAPRLHVIDDHSTKGTRAPRVMQALEDLELSQLVSIHGGDFRGQSLNLGAEDSPIDLAWFDCGGVNDYADFIEEYWPLVNENHGLLILHFTYWPFPDESGSWDRKRMLMSPLLNEIKKQQADSGKDATFEVLSLVEPHKFHQGSVSMIRRLPQSSRLRDSTFEDEVQFLFAARPRPLRKLQAG